jgi:stalled ribosome rescue protein Dom34
MDTKKNLGIWMDHSIANLFDLKTKKRHSIKSEFTFKTKEDALKRSENLMHNKEQQMHEAFYKNIADEILKYDNILLFGPTNAKVELHNYLHKDLHFKDIKIMVESSGKLTENEKDAFMKVHFENHPYTLS